MVEIEFSRIIASNAPDIVTPAIREFEKLTGIRVNIKTLTWSNAWSELTRMGMYRYGPDVSEIGSTWLSDLVGMNVLHPLSQEDIQFIGGAEAFLKPAWQTTSIVGDPRNWAIPWMADTRLLFYRRDLLHHAGLNESTAFLGPAALKETLQQLKAAGIQIPWAITTRKTRMTIHNAAAWVWGAGGHFISEDGKHARFQEPEARLGFQQYFELSQFLAPSARDLDEYEADSLFCTGQAAVTLSGPWLLRQPDMTPEVLANTGFTFPPGVPFVGGSSLVVWQHTRNPKEALELIKFLSGQYMQSTFLPKGRLLPVRLDVLSTDPFSSDPFYQTLNRGLQIGKSFRLIPLWGLIEDRTSSALSQIWMEILQSPRIDIAALLERDLWTLARRLDLALGEATSREIVRDLLSGGCIHGGNRILSHLCPALDGSINPGPQ